MVKLDDAPWKNEGPEESARRQERYRKGRFHVQLFGGGATQLEECPVCFALTREERLSGHMDTH